MMWKGDVSSGEAIQSEPDAGEKLIRGPILIVLHQEQSIPGRVGTFLTQRGLAMDIRRPALGDPLPQTLSEHGGMVIFGGPQSANDPDLYIRDEIDMIGVALKEQAPFLGLCLGAQMMVKQLGGRVEAHPQDHAEIGYYPIEATDHARAMMDWPSHVYQWHREGFCDLPSGTTMLATAPEGHFENQAFQVGPTAFGLQFHPEVTRAMVHRWTTKAYHRFLLPGVRPLHTHFSDRWVHDPAVARWFDRFIDHWLETDARG
jgi:GMP synthase (glutamine-hydrolysing)